MVWLPIAADLPVPEEQLNYDRIFLDEWQDFNPVQLLLLDKLLVANRKTRVLAAGDPHQAICGFRGARTSVSQLRTLLERHRSGVTDFSLPVCWRCPTSHLALARLVVPHIRPAPGAQTGYLRYTDIETAKVDMAVGDYVLCRNSKALISVSPATS